MPNSQKEYDEDRKSAKKELEKRKKQFGAGKGQKLNIVKGGLTHGGKEKAGLGTIGEPNSWIKNSQIGAKPDGSGGWVGRNGSLIVHELLHNAGLKDHSKDSGDVFHGGNGESRIEAGRNLTEEHCKKLAKHFKKHGTTKLNKAQKEEHEAQQNGTDKGESEKKETEFIFEPDNIYYGLLTNPDTARSDTHLGMIELAINEDGQFGGSIYWDEPLAGAVCVDAYVEVNPEAAIADILVTMCLTGKDDGGFDITGSYIQVGETGEVDDAQSLQSLTYETQRFDEIDDAVLSDVVSFSTKAGVVSADRPEIAVEVRSQDFEGEASYRFALSRVPPSPDLTNFPVGARVGETVDVEGSHFTPASDINLYVDTSHVASLRANDNGMVSRGFVVPSLPAGDYIVEAVDADGAFAIGILTVGTSPTGIADVAEPLPNLNYS